MILNVNLSSSYNLPAPAPSPSAAYGDLKTIIAALPSDEWGIVYGSANSNGVDSFVATFWGKDAKLLVRLNISVQGAAGAATPSTFSTDFPSATLLPVQNGINPIGGASDQMGISSGPTSDYATFKTLVSLLQTQFKKVIWSNPNQFSFDFFAIMAIDEARNSSVYYTNTVNQGAPGSAKPSTVGTDFPDAIQLQSVTQMSVG